MDNDDQNADRAGGIAGLVLLALTGLARNCDDIGRVAVRHVDNIAPSYSDDLGRFSMQADDLARVPGQEIDALASLQGRSAATRGEANAVSTLQEGSSATGEDLRGAAELVGKAAAKKALKAADDRDRGDEHQH